MLGDAKCRFGEQATETAKEITSTRHHEGEDGGDDGAAADGRLVGDGVELTHHLGQSPCAERCQDYHTKQTKWCRTKPRGEVACLEIGEESRLVFQVVCRRYCLTHLVQCLHESALTVEHNRDYGSDTEEHDDALNEVVDGSGLISTEDDIYGSEQCHDDGAILVGYAESHLKEFGYSHIHSCGIWNKKNKGDDGCHHAKPLVGVSRTEEVGHGAALYVLCHQFCASSKHYPCQQRTDDGIAHTYP